VTAGTVELVELDPAILDADTECDMHDVENGDCHAVAEYVGTMPCGLQMLACADHMARISTGWASTIGCERSCTTAGLSYSGSRVHWMVDVTWRRA
jgi:hypothetical protein